MTKQNKHSGSNFWFGFSMGIISMAGGAYLVGTKKGREQLKKIMEFAEQYNEKSGNIFEYLHDIKDPKKPVANEIKSSIDSILTKVKNITLEK